MEVSKMLDLRKVLVIGVAVLVAAVPVLAGLELEVGTLSGEGALPTPQGRTLSDEELLETSGELWWLVFLIFAGGGRAVYENWFDEDYGIDRDDLEDIAGTALAGAIGGSAWDTAAALMAFIP
jgi:hypothetical protein